jgi:hypothetical protein
MPFKNKYKDKYPCTSYGNCYFTFTVKDYETFIHEIAPKFIGVSDEYVWRGMRDSNWWLESSLSRELSKMPIRDSNKWKEEATKATVNQLRYYLQQLRGLSRLTREHGELFSRLEELVNEKKRSFIDVTDALNEFQRDIYELFALGQHHNMLTPFLDWTRVPLVALYFAFKDSDERPDGVGDRVIYALNKTRIMKECPPFSKSTRGDGVIFTDSMAYDNPRIIGQSGLFTYIPANEPLDRWVVQQKNFTAKKEPVLLRFIIPNKNRSSCLKELALQGIDPRTIYPDLEGAALEVNSKLKADLANLSSQLAANP